MVDAEEDIVFFDYINVLSEDVTQKLEEREQYRKYIAAYLEGDKSEDLLRYYYAVPWTKMVKGDLVERHGFRFPEIKWGEDVYFACCIGHAAKSIRVSGTIGYVVTSRKGSVTDNFCATSKGFQVRVNEMLKCDDLLRDSKGANYRSRGFLGYVFRKKGFARCVWFGIANVFHPRVFWTTALFLARVEKNKVKSLLQ